MHELLLTNPAQIFDDGDRWKMRAPENKRSSDMKKEKKNKGFGFKMLLGFKKMKNKQETTWENSWKNTENKKNG